jgi:FkbM family methyltransferase
MGVYTDEPFLSILRKERLPVIFEVGSRDGDDALKLQESYNPDLLCAFEPNPEAIKLCKSTLAGRAGVRLFELACWHETGRIPFYPVAFSFVGDRLTRNIGASSCFLDAHTYTERLVQKEIEVEAVRLEDLMRRSGFPGSISCAWTSRALPCTCSGVLGAAFGRCGGS